MSTSEGPMAEESPELFDGQPPSEILAPIALTADDRVELAGRYGRHWNLPLRLVHVSTPDDADDGSSELQAAVSALRSADPGLAVDGEVVDADSVAAGIAAAATDRSVVFLPSARGSRWLDEDSVGVGVVQAFNGLALLYGPACVEPPVGSSVIVPLDGTRFAEQALAPAFAVAAQTGAAVWLVTIGPAASIDAVSEMMLEGIDDSERRYLEQLTTRYSGLPLDIRWETTSDGDPVAGIDALAAEHGASLVVAATHGDIEGRRAHFGSVCMGIVERGSVPALLVTPGGADESART